MPPTILVVDDHAETCTLIQRILTPQGYAVSTVADGEAALAAVATRRPGLVIADLCLPGLDGLTMIAKLRQHDPLLPIIAVSADPGALRQLAAAAAGVGRRPIPHLTKPFFLAPLVTLVHQQLPPA